MSIRTNPMKAVPVLLKRLKTTRAILDQGGTDESLDGKLNKLEQELNKIEDVFMRVKKNQDELIDTLHEVDGHLRKLDRKRLDQDMDQFCKRIRDCAHKLLPMDTFESDSSDHESGEIVQSSSHGPFSTQHNNNHLLPPQHVELTPEMLISPLRSCLRSLIVFPEDVVIKKRHTIYWWIGKGLVENTREKTAEEVGEHVIDELLKFNLIVTYGNHKCPLVNKFKLNPHIRPHLDSSLLLREYELRLGFNHQTPKYPWLLLDQQKVVLGDGDRLDSSNWPYSVFNVCASYLNFQSPWLTKRKNLQVLQLGRWQESPSHHIEVGSQEFLKDLRNQKELRFLSLRGISRISELPPSIAQLESLQILDLKACHNLETLPDDISSLKSLTHLILSQCYLLNGMPKGIEKLTKLQVLKGFLIGSPSKTPCRISDLANLQKLRRLSIRIGIGAVIKEREFESLEELSALEYLKISWGVSRYSDIPIILPLRLIKLHLECFPGQRIPDWVRNIVPSTQFPYREYSRGIQELHITGGKLESMNIDKDSELWTVKFVRLRYLKHLQVDIKFLKELFPNLRYVEIKKVGNVSYFEWRKEEREG